MRGKGKQQADKAAPKLPPYAPIVFQGEPSRVRVPKLYIKTKKLSLLTEFFLGALEGTRTPDPLIRSQVLYPAELPAHIAILY